ncbi:hypothetical protein Pint_09662 [Pistacia integerrima]|uniref:Uncharacterized protein n=1 Tax=Pistacia integerrima TaxID=434235 RepID=A0ACC0XMG7_9ROSI|nr:hypothetical protein Pint_09662 [Pistacia integerrima]
MPLLQVVVVASLEVAYALLMSGENLDKHTDVKDILLRWGLLDGKNM